MNGTEAATAASGASILSGLVRHQPTSPRTGKGHQVEMGTWRRPHGMGAFSSAAFSWSSLQQPVLGLSPSSDKLPLGSSKGPVTLIYQTLKPFFYF